MPGEPPELKQSLTRSDRDAIVRQTHGGKRANARTPLQVKNLRLSSLGAWFDWKGSWEFESTIVDYRHQAFMGRDGYVRVVYPGFLYPFGHRCILVQIKHRGNPVAYLWQRRFIVLRQPTLDYPPADRDNPFGRISVSPLGTPDIDLPDPYDGHPFVPSRNGRPFPFTLTTVDRGGEIRSWSAPLVFVQATKRDDEQVTVLFPEDAPQQYGTVQPIQGRGQTLAVAPTVKAGDTSIEVAHLIFGGEIDAANVTSRPFLIETRAVVPSMRHLAPQAPAVDLVFAKPYLDHGLPARALDAQPLPGTPNAGELILALKSKPAVVDFTNGSDRSGGFVAPNLSVQGISRALGALGESGAGPSSFS